jgi:hypothetical protein
MRLKLFSIVLILVVLTLACNLLSQTPTPDLEATVNAAVALTEAARPTITPTKRPSLTPTPSPTPAPTETPTPEPEPLTGEENLVITELENGWTRYEVLAGGFEISLPPDWKHLDLTQESFDDILEAAGENNPALEAFLASGSIRSLVAAGLKFMALDLSVESLSANAITNVNVLTVELPVEIPLATLLEASIQQTQQLFQGANYQQDIVQIGDLEAGLLTYEAELVNVTGEPQDTVFHQYLILVGQTQYVITFTGPLDLYEENVPLFEEIAESFVLTE